MPRVHQSICQVVLAGQLEVRAVSDMEQSISALQARPRGASGTARDDNRLHICAARDRHDSARPNLLFFGRWHCLQGIIGHDDPCAAVSSRRVAGLCTCRNGDFFGSFRNVSSAQSYAPYIMGSNISGWTVPSKPIGVCFLGQPGCGPAWRLP